MPLEYSRKKILNWEISSSNMDILVYNNISLLAYKHRMSFYVFCVSFNLQLCCIVFSMQVFHFLNKFTLKCYDQLFATSIPSTWIVWCVEEAGNSRGGADTWLHGEPESRQAKANSAEITRQTWHDHNISHRPDPPPQSITRSSLHLSSTNI